MSLWVGLVALGIVLSLLALQALLDRRWRGAPRPVRDSPDWRWPERWWGTRSLVRW